MAHELGDVPEQPDDWQQVFLRILCFPPPSAMIAPAPRLNFAHVSSRGLQCLWLPPRT